MDTYRTVLNTFDVNSLPHLDTVVMGALELFSETSLPTIDTSAYTRPLVIGSGNAEATGRILFAGTDAVYGSESTYKQILATTPAIDGVVIISASGEKDAPQIVSICRESGKPVTLLTNAGDSSASRALDGYEHAVVHVFPKNREPYTYNTSTYLGMILASTHEDPRVIMDHIDTVVASITVDFAAYDKYYLIIPGQFAGVSRMLSIKFIELFGRRVAYSVETDQYVRHATTVVPSDELFISFGTPNTTWGNPENRLHIALPDGAGYAAMMATSYAVIGRIQAAHPPYFADNIAGYIEQANQLFSSSLTPIVEGN